jgi:hypothetical protein
MRDGARVDRRGTEERDGGAVERVSASAVEIERGEEPIHGVIRVLSGVPERSTARALHRAFDVGLPVNRGGAYVLGIAWPQREDRVGPQHLGQAGP